MSTDRVEVVVLALVVRRIAHALGVVSLLALLFSPARAEALFDSRFLGFETGGAPGSVILTDFDGDGHLDLLMADQGASGVVSTSLSFMRGRGDGTFEPRVAIATGTKPVSVRARDLGGDGRLDLVVSASSDDAMWVHKGTGPGTFAPPTMFPLGNYCGAIELADMDGDGFFDALISHPNYPTGITVRFGAARDSFAEQIDLPSDAYTNVVVSADLDGDGKLDLVATNTGPSFGRDSTLALFRNLGGRAFAPPVNAVAGLGPIALASGRFDADTFADFAVACPGDSTIRILLSDGAGHLTRTTTFFYDREPQDVIAGDVNGDSRTDLIVTLQYYGLCVYLGNGDGTFAAPLKLEGPYSPGSMALGDADEDGKIDLAVASRWGIDTPTRGAVAVMAGNGSGGFGRGGAYPAGTFGVNGIAVDDLDGDGKKDVLSFLRSNHAIAFLKGDGLGHLAPAVLDPVIAAPVGMALASLDAGIDKDLVLTMGTSTGYLSLRPGNGDGSFGAGTTVPVGRFPGYPAVADFDGNGTLDVLVPKSNADSVAIAFTDGAGAIDSLRYRKLNLNFLDNIQIRFAAVAMMDADTWPDLVVATSNGIEVYWGASGGHFPTRTSYALTPGAGWRSVTIGDVNGDLLRDIVVSSLADRVSVIRSAGGRNFRPPLEIQTGSEPSDVEIADVTSDGRPDLITADNGGFSVSLLPQQPDSTFGPRFEYGSGAYSQDVVVSDINGDSRPDILVAQPYPSSYVSVLLNTGDLATGTTWSAGTISGTGEGIQVTWLAPTSAVGMVPVERNEDGGGWRALGVFAIDGTGTLRLEDRDVRGGHSYGYRLRVGPDATRAEVWIDLPAEDAADRFSLEPSPVTDLAWARIQIAHPAEGWLELLDLQGRIVLAKRLGWLPAGSHRVNAFNAAEIHPGVYFARLRGIDGMGAARRVVIFR